LCRSFVCSLYIPSFCVFDLPFLRPACWRVSYRACVQVVSLFLRLPCCFLSFVCRLGLSISCFQLLRLSCVSVSCAWPFLVDFEPPSLSPCKHTFCKLNLKSCESRWSLIVSEEVLHKHSGSFFSFLISPVLLVLISKLHLEWSSESYHKPSSASRSKRGKYWLKGQRVLSIQKS
jgi:hypothetical protein